MLNCGANNIYGEDNQNGGSIPPSNPGDEIISVDTTSSIVCNNGVSISSIGSFNFNNNSLLDVKDITGDNLTTFHINKNNVVVEMAQNEFAVLMDSQIRLIADNTQTQIFSPNDTGVISQTDSDFEVNINSQLRFQADGTDTLVISPDGATGVGIANDQLALAITSLGGVFFANPTSTTVKSNTEQILLESGKITNSVPLVVPSNQTPSNPDVQWVDSPNTGVYSSATGQLDLSCAGVNVAHFDSSGTMLPNNTKTDILTINGHYSLPTTTPSNGQYIGATGGIVNWVSAFNGFQAFYNGGTITINIGASSTSICNVLQLGSNYNTGTFTYTAPTKGIYELNFSVNWFWTSTVAPSTGRLDVAFRIVDGVTTFPGYTIMQFVAPALSVATNRGLNSMHYFQQLNAGATVQISLANNSSSNPITIDSAYFGGRLVQEN